MAMSRNQVFTRQLHYDISYNFWFQEVAKTSALYVLKLLVLTSWQGFYSPIDTKINPHLCLDVM